MKRRLLVLMLVVLLLPGCKDSGDRVLVSKYLYESHVLPPDRFDVVVFKFPEKPIEAGTPKNYIKRLMGLPGEIIAIFFGQLFHFVPEGPGVPEGLTPDEWKSLVDTSESNPLDLWKMPPKNHETAKKLWDAGKFKVLAKPPHVMLALSRPVYDHDHPARDLVGVLPDRWAPVGGSAWAADTSNGFKIDGVSKNEEWLRYRHILRPERWPAQNAADRESVIQEIKTGVNSYHWPQLVTDFLGYNTYKTFGHPGPPPPNWSGDLMLDCKLTVDDLKGEFWLELAKGVDRFQARFDLAKSECSLYRWNHHKTKPIIEGGQQKEVPDWQWLATEKTPIKSKGDFQLRFANYNERLTVWVGRELIFGPGKDYPLAAGDFGPDREPLDQKAGLDGIKNNDLQPASMCGVGAAVQVHQIKLWRDTYYTGTAEASTNDHHNQVLGDHWKDPKAWDPLRHLEPRTIYIYPGHYLCLGDNSPESSDSRAWGLVPDRLMLGRALMVYFPFERAGLIK